MKTVIEMAIKAGAIPIHKDYKHRALVGNESLERFAELVRAAEREAIIQEIPGGFSVDPQWVCDMIRARSNT